MALNLRPQKPKKKKEGWGRGENIKMFGRNHSL
jgi:hypothetical protein